MNLWFALRKSIWFQFFQSQPALSFSQKTRPLANKKNEKIPRHSGRYPKFQWEKGADIPRYSKISPFTLVISFSSCWGMPVRWLPHVYPEEGTWNSFAFQQVLNPKISTKGCLSVIFEKRPPQFCHEKLRCLQGKPNFWNPLRWKQIKYWLTLIKQ